MQQVAFRDLPVSVRVMTGASMFMGWVLVAEFVIDRYGLDAMLPLYRYGDICVYELAAAGLVALFWFVAHRRR